jgi:uncharacterized protein DUF3592
MNFNGLMTNLGGLIAVLVGVPFVLVALYLLYRVVRSREQVADSRNWLLTTGRVMFVNIEARTTHHQHGYSTAYYPVVVYEYMVNGMRFQNNRISFGGQIGLGMYSMVQNQVAKYVVGGPVPVYYDPSNPQEAVLERRAPANKILIFVAVLIAAILACTLIPTLFGMSFLNQFLSFLPH